jgi:hypothetical protein
VEDLDDKDNFSSKINLDMDIDEMRREMLKYIELICSTGLKSLRTVPDISHVIELVEPKPFREKQRHIPHAERADFNALLKELSQYKIIVPSNSPYSSQPFSSQMDQYVSP